jgi:hypothetical protein
LKNPYLPIYFRRRTPSGRVKIGASVDYAEALNVRLSPDFAPVAECTRKVYEAAPMARSMNLSMVTE